MQQNEMEKKIGRSVAEVASVTSLSKSFLRIEIKAGKLKARKFGRRVVILDADLEKYLESAEIMAEAA